MAEASTPTGPVKLVILPRTRAALGRDGLRRYLEAVHGPMVVDETAVSGRFTSYVHHYAQDWATSGGISGDMAILEDRDAVTIIRTPTMADLALSKACDGYRKRIGPDEDNFREAEGSLALLADEIEAVPGVDCAGHKLFIFRSALPKRFDDWADQIGMIVRDNGLCGAVINAARTIEGQFPFIQFDEVGLSASCDPATIAGIIHQSALAHFGNVETKVLLAEPVRFI